MPQRLFEDSAGSTTKTADRLTFAVVNPQSDQERMPRRRTANDRWSRSVTLNDLSIRRMPVQPGTFRPDQARQLRILRTSQSRRCRAHSTDEPPYGSDMPGNATGVHRLQGQSVVVRRVRLPPGGRGVHGQPCRSPHVSAGFRNMNCNKVRGVRPSVPSAAQRDISGIVTQGPNPWV